MTWYANVRYISTFKYSEYVMFPRSDFIYVLNCLCNLATPRLIVPLVL